MRTLYIVTAAIVLGSAAELANTSPAHAMQAVATSRQAQVNRADSADAPSNTRGIAFHGTQTIHAGDYDAGPIRAFFLGRDYRDIWDEEIQAPVLNFEETAGGLRVTGSAGGLQSALLFLEGADGRHFVLRKVAKRAGDAIPEGTRGTILEDIVEDQISSMNPYAAFVIDDLASAAGVLHTAPVLVIVPDHPMLGEHREAFAGELALLERKVDEKASDAERFAYSEEVIDFETLLERLNEDAAAQVDERAYARARLFDMFLGDRDRHDAQWFWAAVDDGAQYLPLPIDRDFAFARFDGLLNRLGRMSGRIVLRKQTYFHDEIDNLVGLNHQGAKLDIRFTSRLTREDWITTARDLQAALTDEVIENAIRQWPEPVYRKVGPETIEILKSRRDDLPWVAEEYFELLMQKVDVVGSDQPEQFTVSRGGDGLDVVVSYDGEETYRRHFPESETDEIRLYGLGGADEFMIDGADEVSTNVFVVGGDGEDVFRGDGSRIRFYDTELPEASRERVAFRHLDDPSRNEYQLHRYQFDQAGPALSFDYDSDEGIYIGGGIKMTRYGFMREPFASSHKIVANYAPRSRGYNIHYDGIVNEFIGQWDAEWEADVLDIDRFDDFYGFGNETSGSDANRDRYIAHFRWITAYPAFKKDLTPAVSFAIGPYFEYADIEPPSGVSERDPDYGLTADDFVDKYFGGIRSRFVIDTRDSTDMPRSGIRFETGAGLLAGFRTSDSRFGRITSEISTYLTPVRPVTLALRLGGATNIGDFNFYQANTVGGRENLRGFRRTRFAGRSSAFANGELRLALTDLNIYLTRGELGVFGFYDIGRVWADDESSNRWHQGYGGGLWYTPFYELVVRAGMGYSTEGSVLTLSTGMFF